MATWFLLAIISAIFSGIAAFYFKVAAKKDFNSELFILYGAVASSILLLPLALTFDRTKETTLILIAIGILSGVIASFAGILKVYALRYIDTTIYFPLFKLFSPVLVIITGMIFFSETFTTYEWTGLILSLFIPLMLIHRSESTIQNNLLTGLVMVILTSLLAALAAGTAKYVADEWSAVFAIAFVSALGVTVGSLFAIIIKNKTVHLVSFIKLNSNKHLLTHGIFRSVFINISFVSALVAYTSGGSLAIVYAISSMYILIPIVLAVIFYNEHLNFRKASAIALSIVALVFLG